MTQEEELSAMNAVLDDLLATLAQEAEEVQVAYLNRAEPKEAFRLGAMYALRLNYDLDEIFKLSEQIWG